MTGCTICGKPLLGLSGLEFGVPSWMLDGSQSDREPPDCHLDCLRNAGELEMWASVVIDYFRRTFPTQVIASSPTAIALVNTAADRCDIYSLRDGETGFSYSQLPPVSMTEDSLVFSAVRNSYLNTRDPIVARAVQAQMVANGSVLLSDLLRIYGLDACYDMDSFSITASQYQFVPEYQREWSDHSTKCRLKFVYVLTGDSARVGRAAIPHLRPLWRADPPRIFHAEG